MPSGTINFGGIASGLDTQNIISQLVGLRERQLLTPINANINKIKTVQTAFSPLESAFTALKSAAKTLKSIDNAAYNVKKGTSSDTDIVTVGSVNSNTTIAGTYQISNISQLAQADKVIFNGIASKTSATDTGTFTVTYKSNTYNVAISSSNNTLEGIVSQINSNVTGVTASIINDGTGTPYRLVLTANDTGSTTTITHTINTTITQLSVDSTASSNAANEPQNASFKVNSVTMGSTSNTVSDAIPGVTFTLLGTETTNTINLTVKQDTSKIVSSISSFITSYVTLKKSLSASIMPDPVTKQFGPLGRDITLSSANVNISNILTRRFSGLTGYDYKALTDIGITLNSKGDMEVDTAKLTTALEDNPTDVRLLFQGDSSEDGIAEDMYDYLDALTNANGIFVKKKREEDKELLRLQKLFDERSKLVSKYKETLQAKYVALERALSRLKLQEQQMASFTQSFENSSK